MRKTLIPAWDFAAAIRAGMGLRAMTLEGLAESAAVSLEDLRGFLEGSVDLDWTQIGRSFDVLGLCIVPKDNLTGGPISAVVMDGVWPGVDVGSELRERDRRTREHRRRDAIHQARMQKERRLQREKDSSSGDGPIPSDGDEDGPDGLGADGNDRAGGVSGDDGGPGGGVPDPDGAGDSGLASAPGDPVSTLVTGGDGRGDPPAQSQPGAETNHPPGDMAPKD